MGNVRHVLGIDRVEKLGDTIPHHHHHLDIKVDLSEDEYEQFRQTEHTLNHFVSYGQLLMVPILNYQEYHRILQASLDARISRDPQFDPQFLYLDINRAALNLLSSVRTYLDHTETSLNRDYGIFLAFLNFKQACSYAYDTFRI
jgi:hypothetical protein